MAELSYKVEKELGAISSRGEWSKELNFISWNGRDPKFDIRDWNTEKTKMGKGLTLSVEEARALKEILNKIDFNSF
ncbi:MAG: YdbC family protein [Paraclostridium sp.]